MSSKTNKKKVVESPRKKRAVDVLADEVAPWWDKNYTTIGKKQVATWKGALILMFMAGISSAMIWSAKTENYDTSSAAAASTLYFTPATQSVAVGGDVTLTAMINPGTNQIAAVELHVTFDKTKFSLTSITAPAAPSNCSTTPTLSTVLQGAVKDNVNGTGAITVGGCVTSPASPIVTTSTVATFVFHALAVTSGSSPINFAATTMASAVGESGNVLVTMTGAGITVNQADVAAPTGGSISYTNGYFTSTSVALTANDGTDAGSGLNTGSRIIQRRSATLTNGSCGTYGSYATITPTGTYPNFTDTTVASGNCYQYQYLISDNASPVANQATYTTTNVAKIDTAVPTGGSITYTDGYFTSTSVALTATDGTDAVSGINTGSRIVQRKSATLSAGSCGTYGAFATVSPTGTYPNITDSTVASGNCYQYQYLISDNAGKQSTYTTTNVAKIDTAVPTGGSITYTDGYFTSTSVALTATDGSDAVSGINTGSRIVQRKSAALSAGSCGSFGTFATITPTGTYPNITDSTVASGNCYQYQYLISDNAGKQSTYTTTNVAKIDTVVPTGGSASITDGFNSNHSIVITVADGTDAISGINTSSRAVQRKSATMTNGNCGSYGSWATISPAASYPTFTDTSVVTGNCYQYQYLISDIAGKQAAYATTNTAKITYTADLTLDGTIDIFDYNLLFTNFGNASCGNVADMNNDCIVNIFDYSQLYGDFGKSV